MKKNLLLILSLIAFAGVVRAGSGGPDAFGYVWRDDLEPNGPVFNWIDITSRPGHVVVEGLTDDNTVGPFSTNFNFHYYWYDVNQFWIGSNGYIAFQNAQLSASFPVIPSTAQPHDFISAMGADINFSGFGNPAQCVFWASPSGDSLVVSWIDAPFWNPASPTYSGSNTFQIVLSAVDSSITFQYQTQTGTYAGGSANYLSAGIENVSGGVGLQSMLNPPASGGSYIQTPYAVKFYYPATTTYQAIDASTVYNDNPTNGGRFLSYQSPVPWTMTSQVKNTGNSTLSPFDVKSYVATPVFGLTGTIHATETQTTSGLAPAATANITMSQTFTAPSAGTYIQVTRTLYPGDIVPTNDSSVLELVVVDTTAGPVTLTYDDGQEDGTGLNWQGGDGGAGMEFIPPYYPCKITMLHAYIQANPNAVGFYFGVYDDNGPGGTAGVMLDSIYVSPANFTAPQWVDVILPAPIVITSGSFFVSWNMDGEFIAIGQDESAPISNRSFEVLANSWAIYRSRQFEDFMINATIDTVNMPVGISTVSLNEGIGEFYPNPSANRAEILVNESSFHGEAVLMRIFGVDGKAIGERTVYPSASTPLVSVNVSTFAAGVYICTFEAKGQKATRRLVVN